MSNIPSTNSVASSVPAKVSTLAETATPAANTSAAKATAAGNLSTNNQTTAQTRATAATQPAITSNRPVLEEPKVAQITGEALNTLLQMLTNTSTELLFKNAGTALDGIGKQLKAENEKRANEDQKAREATLKSQNQSFWSKLWGYVSKIATVVAAVAMTAVTGGAAFGFAVVMAASAVAGLIKSIAQDAGATWADKIPTSIGDIFSKALVAVGVDEKIAGYVSMAVDIGLAVAGLGVGVVGIRNAIKGAQNAMKNVTQQVTNQKRLVVANSLAAGGSAVAGTSQVGVGVQSYKVAESTAQSQTAQANSKEIQSNLTKLQALFNQLTDEMNQIQQTAQSLIQEVSKIIATQKQSFDMTLKKMA